MITVDQLPAKMRDKIRVVQIEGCPVSASCWEWNAGRTTAGYGIVRIDRNPYYTHRVAYLALVGPIPDGLQIDHLCRNRACCNPDHLEPVTPHVNTLRGEKATKKRCVNDHPLSGDNLIWSNNGPDRPRTRRCRTCYYESHRQSHQRHGAKWNATRRARYQPRRDPALCANGHEWADGNTRIKPSGHRLCRQCERDRKRRWREGAARKQVAA